MRISDYALIETKVNYKKWRWPVIIITVALALYGFTQVWLVPQVEGYPVVKEELIQTFVASGKVEVTAEMAINSSVNARIAAIKVAAGETVSAGQELLVLENRDGRLAVDRARAATAQAEARFRKISEQTQAGSEQSLSRARAALDNAKKQYARANELAAKGYISQSQASDALRNLTIAQSQLATAQFQAKANRAKGSEFALAEAALNKARANERVARENADNLVLKAESAGTVISCQVARGETVASGKTLMLIAPQQKSRLFVQLDEKYVPDLKPGQSAWVKVDDHGGQRFKATLSNIVHDAAEPGKVIGLRFDVIAPPDFLRQGMQFMLAIEIARQPEVLSIPYTAIRNAGSEQPWVMVVQSGHTQRRSVKLGMRGLDKVEILEGLREGEFVLAAPAAEVEEGRRIPLARAT